MPVRRRDLIGAAAVVSVLSWALVRRFYGELPGFDWWLPVPVGLLAVAEALGARTLTVRLRAERDARAGRRPPDPAAGLVRRVEPLLVARVAVLAQASAYVGAVFAGVWAGVLLFTVPQLGTLSFAGSDTRTALLGLVLALALAGAALWLEYTCRLPGSPGDPPLHGDPPDRSAAR